MPPNRPSVENLLSDTHWVRSLALSLVRDPHRADDLVQRTWVRVLERPPQGVRSASSWLGTVMRNLVRDDHRSETRRKSREARCAARDPAPSTADLVIRADAQQRLTRAVIELDEPYRTVVLLRFFDDLSPREIGERTGVPSATARTRLHRGLARLRDELESSDPRGWRLALAPLAALPIETLSVSGPGATASTLMEGLVVTSKQKLTAVAVLLLLLLLGGTWWAADSKIDRSTDVPSVADTDEPEHATRRRARTPASTTPTADVPGAPAGSSDTNVEAATDRATRHLTPIWVRSARDDVPEARAPDDEDAILDAREVSDAIEIDDADDGVAAGGLILSAGVSRRFARVRPHGNVTWSGIVRDASGRPLPDAWVLRIALDAEERPVRRGRYVFFDKLVQTDADGRFSVDQQPSGAWMLQADYRGRNRTDGHIRLDTAEIVRAADGQNVSGLTFEVDVLPATLGSVEVTLTDRRGAPVRGDWVSVGPSGDWTDLDGRVRVTALDAGTLLVATATHGFVNQTREIELEPGGTQKLAFQLRRKSVGAHTISGRVRDESGRPAVNAAVFLGVGDDDDRSGRTDAEGRFTLHDVPARGPDNLTRLFVIGNEKNQPFTNVRLADLTVPHPPFDLVVTRLARVVLHVTNSRTKEPVHVFNCGVVRHPQRATDEESRAHREHRVSNRTGQLTFDTTVGGILLTLAAPGLRTTQVLLDIPDSTAPWELSVALEPE